MLPAYIAVFMLFSLLSAWSSLADEDPRWMLALDVVSSAVAAAGLVALWRDWQSAELLAAWKVVAPATVLAYAITFTYETRRLARGDFRAKGWQLAAHTAGAVVITAPALWLNLRLAFG